MANDALLQLAERLGSFECKFNNLMRNEIGLSVEGQAIGIGLLTTMHMPLIAECAAALRARASQENSRG